MTYRYPRNTLFEERNPKIDMPGYGIRNQGFWVDDHRERISNGWSWWSEVMTVVDGKQVQIAHCQDAEVARTIVDALTSHSVVLKLSGEPNPIYDRLDDE